MAEAKVSRTHEADESGAPSSTGKDRAVDDRRAPGGGPSARVEREQRWVLSGAPSGLGPPRRITDRYVLGTRLRLRTVEEGGQILHKVGQKVRVGPSPEMVHLTNIYLSSEEHAVLVGLPAAVVRKTRRTLQHVGRSIAVDELHGELDGLVLAEVELAIEEPRLPVPPPLALADVTADERFSGGQLATTDRVALQRLLALFNAGGR